MTKDADNHDIRTLIREIKYKKNINQKDIATLLGVRNTYLSDMLNGRVPVTNSIIDKLYELNSNTPTQTTPPKYDTYLIQQLLNEKDRLLEERELRIKEKDEMIAILKDNMKMLSQKVELLETRLDSPLYTERQHTKNDVHSAAKTAKNLAKVSSLHLG